MTIEHAFQCPSCWETITMIVDLTEASAEYVEDCEVCCRPIQVTFSSDGSELTSFRAESLA